MLDITWVIADVRAQIALAKRSPNASGAVTIGAEAAETLLAHLTHHAAEPTVEEIASARHQAQGGDQDAWRSLCHRYPEWNENGGSADAWADDSELYL
jgi:hypothetical protein